MKKVAVPLAGTKFPEGARLGIEIVRETYAKKLVALGLTPIFLTSYLPEELALALYEECSGVLLMGGSDIDPARYGAVKDPNTSALEPLRDELEIMITKRALSDHKPLLGICRGIQILNVAAGGTLIQHLPDAVPNEHHGFSEGGTTYDALLYPTNGHDILISEGSRARQMIGKDKVHANSAHHQAVDRVGERLIVSGRSPGGVVEIIEHQDPSFFCFALQSHPECCGIDPANDPADLEVFFKAFKEAIDSI